MDFFFYRLSHKGSPRILEWVDYPFSCRSSQPSNCTRVSCVAGRFFTSSATREAIMSDSLRPHGLSPPRLLHPWNFPGKNTGVGCHFLLQEIFPTQGLNLGLPYCRQTLYPLSQQGSSIMIMSRSIHISANGVISFFFMAE